MSIMKGSRVLSFIIAKVKQIQLLVQMWFWCVFEKVLFRESLIGAIGCNLGPQCVKRLMIFNAVWITCVKQPEPEFRPPMSEIVQALVRMMQRTSFSKLRSGDNLGAANQSLDRCDTSIIYKP